MKSPVPHHQAHQAHHTPHGYLSTAVHSLGLLAGWGCSGFSCSEQTLAKIQSWSATSQPPQTGTRPRTENLDQIRALLINCQRCGLSQYRQHILFGEGHPQARLFILGSAPSPEEDRSGHFFSGPSGELLLRMIRAMKLTIDQIYICHMIKCRPADDHGSWAGPIQTCRPFWERQLKAIKPKVICTLGDLAAKTLLDESEAVENLRGRFYEYNGIKVMPTFDPTYLLSNPDAKRWAWEDLKKIMAYLRIPL